MKIIITERQLKRLINEQTSSFQQYVDGMVNDPSEFLNKLNTNPELKQNFINEYNKNTSLNFTILSDGRAKFVLKQKQLIGYVKDLGVDPPKIEEFTIRNNDDYDNLKKYFETEKGKGRKITLIVSASLKGIQGGVEFAECANTAIGQKYF